MVVLADTSKHSLFNSVLLNHNSASLYLRSTCESHSTWTWSMVQDYRMNEGKKKLKKKLVKTKVVFLLLCQCYRKRNGSQSNLKQVVEMADDKMACYVLNHS